MTTIRFYHLERQGVEQALPALVGKALSGGHRIVVRTADQNAAERLSSALWTNNPNSFLPHGTTKDGHEVDQPVWLTDKDENPNKADVLILTQGMTSESTGDFDLCCEMLDGRNEQAVSEARARWKDYKEQGHDVTYWQQSAQGGWSQKA